MKIDLTREEHNDLLHILVISSHDSFLKYLDETDEKEKRIKRYFYECYGKLYDKLIALYDEEYNGAH